MKVKVSELTGIALDWAVAKCENLPLKLDPMGFKKDSPDSILSGWWVWDGQFNMIIGYKRIHRNQHDGYSPSTDWAQGGPIIEREQITVCWQGETWVGSKFNARVYNEYELHKNGPTVLIAAMRCYVASKLGEDVDIPDELLLK